MSMYYNATTGELTSRSPWGNHYYDDQMKEEMYAEWTEVAIDYVPEMILATAQKMKLSELEAAAASAYVAGFSSSATGTALWYDSDTSTQSQITATALLAVASATQFATMYPDGITIRAKAGQSADNSTKQKHLHTASQIITLSTDMQTMLAAVKSKLWSYQDKVYVATTVEEVEAITWQ